MDLDVEQMVHGNVNIFRKELKVIGNVEVNTTNCRHDNLDKKEAQRPCALRLSFTPGMCIARSRIVNVAVLSDR